MLCDTLFDGMIDHAKHCGMVLLYYVSKDRQYVKSVWDAPPECLAVMDQQDYFLNVLEMLSFAQQFSNASTVLCKVPTTLP